MGFFHFVSLTGNKSLCKHKAHIWLHNPQVIIGQVYDIQTMEPLPAFPPLLYSEREFPPVFLPKLWTEFLVWILFNPQLFCLILFFFSFLENKYLYQTRVLLLLGFFSLKHKNISSYLFSQHVFMYKKSCSICCFWEMWHFHCWCSSCREASLPCSAWWFHSLSTP